jgi:hypothetical protein
MADQIDDALERANKLDETVRKSGISVAYGELDRALSAFKKVAPLEALIPSGEEARLGFSLRALDAGRFFDVYSGLLRKSLCTPEGEFRKLIRAGMDSSVGAILTALVTSLGIPVIALGVMIPVAVIIANTGLETFCELTKDGD